MHHDIIKILINRGSIFGPYEMYDIIRMIGSNVVVVKTTITIPNNNNIPKVEETL